MRRPRHVPVRPRIAALAAALALACAAPGAVATELAAAALPPDLAALPFPAAPPSSTATLAEHLARGLGPGPLAGPFELRVTVSGPAAPPTPDRFAAFAAAAVEAALRRHHPGLGARAAAPAEPSLRLDLSVVVEASRVSATARAVALPTSVWEGLRAPDGQVVATAFAAVPLDLELRTLLGLGRRLTRLDAFRLVPLAARPSDATSGPVLDLLVEDLDGDGTPELVALHPTSVTVSAWGGPTGFAEPRARASLLSLPPNPARVRQPVGRLAVVVRPDGSRALVAASSDRARAAALRLGPAGLEPLDAPLPHGAWPLYAVAADAFVAGPWPSARDVLDGPAALVALGGGPPVALGRLQPAWDLRAFAHFGALSPTWAPVLVASHADGRLRLRSAAQPQRALALSGHGVAAALVDLDADGTPELLATGAGLGGPDPLTLLALGREGARSAVLWRGASPAPVTAVAPGDVDRDGFDELVVASWDGAVARLAILAPVAP